MSGRFAILNPCPKRWTDLSGDGRKRFCDECQTYVHALDQYSAQEFYDLRRESPGRVCGFLTGESLPEPRSRRAVLVGALLTAISPLMAQAGRVRIRVTDVTGAVIPDAAVSVLGEDSKTTRTLKTDKMGEVVLTDLPIGNSRLMVSHPGFKNLPLTVTAQNENEVNVNAKLEVGDFRMGIIVEARPVEPSHEPRAEEPPRLPIPAPKLVVVPPLAPSAPPVEVAQPPRPKRRWWRIFH